MLIHKLQRQVDAIYDRAEQREREVADMLMRVELATATSAMLAVFQRVVARTLIRVGQGGIPDYAGAYGALDRALDEPLPQFLAAWSRAPATVDRRSVVRVVIDGWAENVGATGEAGAVWRRSAESFLSRVVPDAALSLPWSGLH
jgi:hypothetical protein